MTLDSSVYPTEVPATPKLVPVFVINLKISNDPEAIYANSTTDKVLQLATGSEGEFRTVPNSLGLELDVSGIHGFDNLTYKPSHGATFLDCKLYGKTPNGSGVYIKYGGVAQMLEATVKVLTKQEKISRFEDGYITCNPFFEFDDTVEDKYKWVLKENIIGKGRFVRDSDDAIYVQHYAYILRY